MREYWLYFHCPHAFQGIEVLDPTYIVAMQNENGHARTIRDGRSAMLSSVATLFMNRCMPANAACRHWLCTNCAWSQARADPLLMDTLQSEATPPILPPNKTTYNKQHLRTSVIAMNNNFPASEPWCKCREPQRYRGSPPEWCGDVQNHFRYVKRVHSVEMKTQLSDRKS